MSVFPVQLKIILFYFLNQGKLSRKPLVKGYNNYLVWTGGRTGGRDFSCKGNYCRGGNNGRIRMWWIDSD